MCNAAFKTNCNCKRDLSWGNRYNAKHAISYIVSGPKIYTTTYRGNCHLTDKRTIILEEWLKIVFKSWERWVFTWFTTADADWRLGALAVAVGVLLWRHVHRWPTRWEITDLRGLNPPIYILYVSAWHCTAGQPLSLSPKNNLCYPSMFWLEILFLLAEGFSPCGTWIASVNLHEPFFYLYELVQAKNAKKRHKCQSNLVWG